MKKSYSRINVYERTKLLMGCDDTFWINNNKEPDNKMKYHNEKQKVKSILQQQI